MRKLKRLLDVYRFPGFTPMAEVCGVFGDPWAVVITTTRARVLRAVAAAHVSVRLGSWAARRPQPPKRRREERGPRPERDRLA